jgi:hypothetical protein
MAEYVNPTPSEIAGYVYSRDRTARWVRRHSPTRNQFFSPSIPPLPPRADDVLQHDYPSDSESVHSSTESSPPQMVLKYKDGRPDLPMAHLQQPSSYQHHTMNSREHLRPKESQYHRDQHRRPRTLSDQLDAVTNSHRTAEASGHSFRQARQHPPSDPRTLDLPPFPEDILVLPSRTEQASSSQSWSASSHHSHHPQSRPRVTSEQPPLHLQQQNHPQPPRVPSSRHASRQSNMPHAPQVMQTQSDPTPLRPMIQRPHTSQASHHPLYAHPPAPGAGYSSDYSTPPTSIPSSGRHRRSSSAMYGNQYARHPAPPGVPSSNQATTTYAYPAPLPPGQHPPTHVSGSAAYHDSRSKRSLGKGLGNRGVIVEDPEGDDRRDADNARYTGHVKASLPFFFLSNSDAYSVLFLLRLVA